jgi:hydroxymethylbilane synthase
VSESPPLAAVVVGTRGSTLAARQTQLVVELLEAAWPGLGCEVRTIMTHGDRTQRSGEPLPEIGGKGLFTAELGRGLRDGTLDLAVHSLKDLPTEDPEDVAIGAVCLREDARDCLVSRDGATLAELPDGAVVGTSSLRRIAQLRAVRPDVEVRSIRGNVDTRIRKVRGGEYDATLLAAAGVCRLGLEAEVAEWLPFETLLPAPGQGALAVQCRAGDERILELVSAIDDPAARLATTAERAFLRALEAGCTAPVAAHARVTENASDLSSQSVLSGHGASRKRLVRGVGDGVSDLSSQAVLSIELEGLVASVDGQQVVRASAEGDPLEIGERLARDVLWSGADRILGAIRGG